MRMRLKRLGPFIGSGCISCTAKDRQKGKKKRKISDPGLYSLRQMSPICLKTRWVKPTTLVPLQIAVERTPSVAAQLLIDSKKLVGSLRS